ncbi:MAG: VWA domain-containing protein [Lachnospiraceae bacterium]|nr:VWA domain-containing protein [Lachnospiraceae bacterium]
MRIHPVIPIWLMAILCVIMVVVKRKGILPYIRQILIVVLLFIINLRIMIPDGNVESSVQKMNAYVLFVVDDTISMLARDYKGETERLTGVKADCENIIDKLSGAKFSVISFDNYAKVLSPFSNDTEFAKNSINSISPIDELYAKGSSMNICKDTMMEGLKNAKEKGDGSVILFFLSDGENTNGDTLKSFHEAADYIDYGAVLGYGTQEGGVMYTKAFYEEEEEIVQDTTDYPYKDAVSKIDESNLKQMAEDMGIRYINMNTGNEIEDVLKEIKGNTEVEMEITEETGYRECYYFFVFPLVLLLIYEFIVNKRSV